jgi:UrcA family protein
MRTVLCSAVVGLLASGFAGGLALADKSTEGKAMGEVMVSASRVAKRTTERFAKTPVSKVTLSYGVDASVFDLTTPTGQAGLEKAVSDTAEEVCKEIERQSPGTITEQKDCVKDAISKSMVQVRELIAVAKVMKKKAAPAAK